MELKLTYVRGKNINFGGGGVEGDLWILDKIINN